MRAQFACIQTQLPFQGLFEGYGLLLLIGIGRACRQGCGGVAAVSADAAAAVLHVSVAVGPMRTVALGAWSQFLVAAEEKGNRE